MGNHITKGKTCQRVCGQCGKVFEIHPSRLSHNRGKYCSRACRYISQQRKTVCKCEQCGKQFTLHPAVVKAGLGGKYCSLQCNGIARRQRLQFTCLHCGKGFTRKPCQVKQGKGKYCSHECYVNATKGANHPLWRGGSLKYGPNWKEQRKLAYERDKGTCQYCHRKPKKGERSCQVHHIVKMRSFKNDYAAGNALSNLITLCLRCHRLAETGKIALPVRLF
ncbi:MAG: HNH endonuclease [Chloroflexi bacterium]|nr:HNH endonuclease [Chloroflexota bacterium]